MLQNSISDLHKEGKVVWKIKITATCANFHDVLQTKQEHHRYCSQKLERHKVTEMTLFFQVRETKFLSV